MPYIVRYITFALFYFFGGHIHECITNTKIPSLLCGYIDMTSSYSTKATAEASQHPLISDQVCSGKAKSATPGKLRAASLTT